ncbi:MAG: septum site-determining protein MinC [Anaerolineae bacterium]|nr:septum site-determining protein MinC [Anaerolineae bacterium]
MSNERITIKGTSDGLIITVGAGAWPGLTDELNRHLGQRASFFKGGRVALRVGPRQLTRLQLESVGQILNRHNVSLWAVESDSPGTRQAATQLGLETDLAPRPTPATPEPLAAEESSIVVQRTLRSGQVINHPGHVVVIGDVNPGAEIKAGGSVIVWGRLRGAVHAGVGDEGLGERAVVCALQLLPALLRIGEYITRSPGNETDEDIIPEMASVQDGQIIAEPWK